MNDPGILRAQHPPPPHRLCRANSKTDPLRQAPTHGEGIPEREAVGGEAARSKPEEKTVAELAAAGKRPSAPGWEEGDAGGRRSCGGSAGSAGAGEAAEARRHVEERVAFFKSMVRECENEEVGDDLGAGVCRCLHSQGLEVRPYFPLESRDGGVVGEYAR